MHTSTKRDVAFKSTSRNDTHMNIIVNVQMSIPFALMLHYREAKQSTEDELAATRDAKAAFQAQLAAQQEAGEALTAEKAQLAAELAVKQEALQAALARCETAEVRDV